jgi:hypothetical protein
MVMSNNKQTSVEQLFHKLWDEPKDKFTWYTILKEHMAIEKEQILQSLNDGKAMVIGTIENKSLEQYYNETYGGGDK